jgi:glycosyltransferase involved in cell wall biosynthesis
MNLQTCSTCIAAYNEQATISRTLAEFIRQPPAVVDEIVVCANGCTDNTSAVVAELAAREPRVRLIDSRKGKPRAWNRLVASARNDTLVFVDADVEVEAGAIEQLLKGFKPGVIITAGIDKPRLHADPRSWLLAYLLRPRLDSYLNGRLYAARRSALLARIQECTRRPSMPEDLLQEDFWLQVLLDPAELVVVPAARVRFEAGQLRDFPRIKARLRLGNDQIAQRYPALYDSWRRTRRSPNRTLRKKLRAAWCQGGPLLILTRAVDVTARRVSALIWGARIGRLYAEMRSHLEAAGGDRVLSGPGRILSTRVKQQAI